MHTRENWFLFLPHGVYLGWRLLHGVMTYSMLRGIFSVRFGMTKRERESEKYYHTFARQCESVVRATIKVNGEGQTLTPPPPLSPLTDLHQNWQGWLCRGYLPQCKILFRSDKRLCFRACATSRTIVCSAILGHQRKIRQKTRFCARMCLLGVAKPYFNIFTPFLP